MRRGVLYAGLFTNLSVTLAVLGITGSLFPMVIVFQAVIALFLLFAYFFTGRSTKSPIGENTGTGTKVILSLSSLAIVPISALIHALREGWTVGDTIGASVVSLISLLIVIEVIRRQKTKGLKTASEK